MKTDRTTLPFAAEIGKVLHLMIHSLYTNKDIFLRELISNASDACDKLRYEALTRPELYDGDTELRITVSVDKKNRTLTVADNGIGMSREELVQHLGTIAKSGTQEFAERLTGDAGKDTSLIGQFGVGFYSSFMVAEKVTVESRKAGEEAAHRWNSDGTGEFSIEAIEGERPRGTRILLKLRKGEDVYLDSFRLRHIVSTYSDHISFPITAIDAEGKSHEANKASALWTRPKAEITPEQYAEFYHHVAHLPGEPWMVLHNKAEGKIEYTSLLFIPSAQPFDLFHPERRRAVKLYVKRVFITDEGIDLIAHYLRFLRGVIDSEDLPLNISRETLQKNPLLAHIRESIEKRVLSELKKKAGKEPQEYEHFWKEFGAVLKEGLCEAIAPKETILECCRFRTLNADGWTGLDAYISRIKPGQEHIYYLIGEQGDALKRSAQLEGFRQRGIDVLLLSDHVDDFWVNVVHEYKGKKFKSVTRASEDLDAVSPEKKEDAATENSTDPEALGALTAYLKTLLKDKVKDVRASRKLHESAVCLSVDEKGMDIRMERFLVENRQLGSRSLKILELNPGHPIIRTLAERLKAEGENAEIENAARLLLDQACIQEGETLDDASGFSRRLSELLQKALAA